MDFRLYTKTKYTQNDINELENFYNKINVDVNIKNDNPKVRLVAGDEKLKKILLEDTQDTTYKLKNPTKKNHHYHLHQ